MATDGHSSKLWGGRFAAEMADVALDFSESTAADGRMVFEDIWGSQAHAIMLATQGIISLEDLREILRWLEKAKGDWESGSFELKRELEDVPLAGGLVLTDELGLEGRFSELAAKELGLSKKAVAAARSGAAGLVARGVAEAPA